MSQCAAGIVLYNPEINRLRKNLDAICNQVEYVYCYNNGLQNASEVISMLDSYKNLRLIGTGTNVGIATALNNIVKEAEKDGNDWILTLDQDSVSCANMIVAFSELTSEKNVAIICPVIEDIRRKNEKPAVAENTINDVDFCITSGSFMNIQKTLEIGGFDEWLFIGLVDNEICYRIKLNGYRIIRNNAVILNHELGELTPSKFENIYLKLGNVLHNETIKKLSYKRKVNPMRLYYATRNMLYLKKKYVNYMDASMWNKMVIKNSLSSIIRGGMRLDVLKAIRAGIVDGNLTKVKPYYVRESLKN